MSEDRTEGKVYVLENVKAIPEPYQTLMKGVLNERDEARALARHFYDLIECSAQDGGEYAIDHPWLIEEEP